VTIIDDDRPGVLAFESAILKHDASESKCKIVVKRLHDTDGQISVKYRTIQIDKSSNTATPGVDYVEF